MTDNINPYEEKSESKESNQSNKIELSFDQSNVSNPAYSDFISGLTDTNNKEMLNSFYIRRSELVSALTSNYPFLNTYFENSPFSKTKTPGLLSGSNDGFFIDLREWIEPILSGLYIDNLRKIEQADPYEFSLVVDALVDFYQGLIDWYSPINNFLAYNDSLTQIMRDRISSQIQLCTKFIADSKTIKSDLQPLKTQIESFRNLISEIEIEENSLLELISYKENFQKRKIELEELKRKVEEGKLIELKNEVESLLTELAPNEAEYNKLKDEIDLLLKSKSEFEEKLNQSIAKKLFLTNASELIQNIEKQINEYQEKHLKNCGNKIEECKIKIDFTKITSSELLNKDDLNNLDTIENRLNEIDTLIKERLHPQK